MVIETLMKGIEAIEITSDDELEVMDIDQVMGRETDIKETKNMVGMEVNVGMLPTIVSKCSKQDILHDEQDNSTHLHGKAEDVIQAELYTPPRIPGGFLEDSHYSWRNSL